MLTCLNWDSFWVFRVPSGCRDCERFFRLIFWCTCGLRGITTTVVQNSYIYNRYLQKHRHTHDVRSLSCPITEDATSVQRPVHSCSLKPVFLLYSILLYFYFIVHLIFLYCEPLIMYFISCVFIVSKAYCSFFTCIFCRILLIPLLGCHIEMNACLLLVATVFD